MHVTIALLEEDPKDIVLYDEDEIFGENQDKFAFVTRRDGEEHEADIKEILDWFGPAITDHGNQRVSADCEATWVDIDTRKLKPLFDKYWPVFQEEVKNLVRASSQDFSSGKGDITYIMQRLNEAYSFDWLYVANKYGSCKKIADWLRDIQGGGQPLVQRYYILQTYDGGQ